MASAQLARLRRFGFVDDEILAQAGRELRRRLAQVVERALEKRFVGQHRQGGRAGAFEIAGEFVGFEIGSNQTFEARLFSVRQSRRKRFRSGYAAKLGAKSARAWR